MEIIHKSLIRKNTKNIPGNQTKNSRKGSRKIIKNYKIPTPPKMREMPQILTQIINTCKDIPLWGVKRIMGQLKASHLETPNMKGFCKMGIFSRKMGLKGVLRGRKGVLKKIWNFRHFRGLSQPPFLNHLKNILATDEHGRTLTKKNQSIEKSVKVRESPCLSVAKKIFMEVCS